ncbi:MAG TPA: 3-oxoacyl-[acyl-carrier-protein] reductase [Allosphingosinicella sp.]|jgi:3-oxoacyl-[acyl-carrier protein] reductase
MFDLTGKTALVTGASGGIGSAIAAALAARGARVALSGTREEQLNGLRDRLGGDAIVIPADLSDASACDRLVPAAVDRLGGLDILVNNAGCTRDNLSMLMKDDEWNDVIRVNLEAAFRLSRAALKVMIRARQGRIISISSIVGATGNAGQANYAASKGGLVAMSKAMAQEVGGRSITVNCIAPGLISSPMTDTLTDSQKQAILRLIPLGCFGAVDDVAAAAVYLASAEARYVTGQTLHVNGGMAML